MFDFESGHPVYYLVLRKMRVGGVSTRPDLRGHSWMHRLDVTEMQQLSRKRFEPLKTSL
jgi:hypothetical protein